MARVILWELRTRRVQLLATAVLKVVLALSLRGSSSWTWVLVDCLVVTLLAVLLPQDRAPGPGIGRALWLRLAGPLAVVGLYLGLGLLAGLLRAEPWLDQLAASAALLAWASMVVALSELLIRWLGAGASSFGFTAVLFGVLLTGPVSMNPILPAATRAALLLCPVVGAARARGLEVIHQPVVYGLSALDSLEFHYPAWYLQPMLALALAGVCGVAARSIQERRP